MKEHQKKLRDVRRSAESSRGTIPYADYAFGNQKRPRGMRAPARTTAKLALGLEVANTSGGIRGGNTTLDADGAVDIFLAKRRHKKR